MAKDLFMIIETFPPSSLNAVYKRFYTEGRMLPDGLEFIESWMDESGGRVFQVMAAADPSVFDQWTPLWEDLVDFEIIKLRAKPQEKDV